MLLLHCAKYIFVPNLSLFSSLYYISILELVNNVVYLRNQAPGLWFVGLFFWFVKGQLC